MTQRIYISPNKPGTVDIEAGSNTVVATAGSAARFSSAFVDRTITIRTSKGDSQHLVTSLVDTTTIAVTPAASVTETGCYYYLGYDELDADDNSNITLSFAIADIREPDKRNTPWSKTVSLPGTKKNNQVLGHIFEIDIDGVFNPNIKAFALIESDGLQQLKGIMQLLQINRTGDAITYEVSFSGQLKNIFSVLGDAGLSVLDFSAYNHQYTPANVISSWSNNIQKNGATYSNPIGEGYVYPEIDTGIDTDATSPSILNYSPAIYLKHYIDKIFQYAGFTYSSSFFNSTFFKRLIVTAGIPQYDNATIQSRTVIAKNSSDYDFQLTNSSVPEVFPGSDKRSGYISFDNVVEDDGSNYSASSFTFTVPHNGFYNLFSTIVPEVVWTMQSGESFRMEDSGGYTLNFELRIADSSNNPVNSISFSSFYAHSTVISAGDIYTLSQVNGDSSKSIMLQSGQQYHAEIYFKPSPPPTITDLGTTTGGNIIGPVYLRVKANSSFTARPADTKVQPGDTMTLNGAIPQGIKMADLLKTVINAFNLYIDVDKDNETLLLIEPRDDFYAAGETVDWTAKLDISKEIVMKPMAELNYKKYLYTYKSDNDRLNQQYSYTFYNTDHSEIYGEHFQQIDNDFLDPQQTNKVELLFSPAVMTRVADRVVPSIEYIDGSGNVSLKASNPRLLYFSGTLGCNYYMLSDSLNNSGDLINNYPFCGHFDDPDSPTLDLNFGITKMLFWQPANLTDNNLFSHYHSKYLYEITHKDSRIVTAYLHLNPYDIAQLDFRNQFYINGYYLRLNQIIDYDVAVPGVTQVEFIKMAYVQPFVPTSKKYTGGIDDTIGKYSVPGLDTHVKPNNNTYPRNYHPGPQGKGNIVVSMDPSIHIVGGDNVVHDGTVNISIVNGDSNVILPGHEDVTLINTSNQTIDEDGVTYIDGVKYVAAGAEIESRTGTATLSAGTVVVSNASLTSGAVIMLTPTGTGTLNGVLKITDKTDGSFTISSTNAEDTATIDYYIAHY
jgi:hypothetical protein